MVCYSKSFKYTETKKERINTDFVLRFRYVAKVNLMHSGNKVLGTHTIQMEICIKLKI